MSPAEGASLIEQLIREFARSGENTLNSGDGEPAWDAPLVAFSRGDDPLYRTLKASIGSFYWEPVELFRRTFPEFKVEPDHLSVIAWVLPQTGATKEANRRETAYPSERWARSRKFGEEFNLKLRRHVVAWLGSHGIAAVAPQLSPHWSMQQSQAFGHSSSWSERHAAYVSGLGTFGLCDGLITPVGKAMRCGSVIARVKLPPTPRPYASHRAYCPHFSAQRCGACIARCPAGALSEKGHDKRLCREYIENETASYILERWGFADTYGCGLCQTKVPCESRIPKALGP
jgi:epoxyqueuosine reductase